MKVTTERPQEGVRALLIELPAERLSNEIDIAWQQECQSAAIPGFRPGKAPRAIVQRYVDATRIERKALRRLLPAAYKDAVIEAAIKPTGQPDYDVVEMEQEKPLLFRATVSVHPEEERGRNTMTERPNKKALVDALDIYRDAMRPFITRCLKRVRGRRVDDLIKHVLRDDQYNQFEQSVREGRSIEESIDISNFPQLVKVYWQDVFRDAFKSGSDPRDALYKIADARNEVSHPGSQDIERGYAVDRLSAIVSVLGDINAPEQSQAVDEIKHELLPFTTPAHRFRQGGRDVYAFTLDLETLDNLLPDRVDESVVRDANRPLTASHAKNIQKYLQARKDWLLGTLLLGISPDAVEFQSYMPDSDAETAVGTLTISTDGIASMKMFDGQHRRRAIKDVLAEYSHSARSSKRLWSPKEASLPIMLYAEDSIKALRQMFADAAQTRSIERNTVTRFDQRDAFNLTALSIAENSDLFAGRVEMERASVSRNSHNIIAINQLAMTLKTLEVGYKGRVSRDRSDVYMLNLESLYEKCLDWADDFMPAARREYNDLMSGEIDNSDIPQERAKTMAYNATVIRILAGCYYEWTKDGDDWKPLAEFLRGASLRPRSNAGALLVDAGVVAPGATSPEAQLGLVVQAIDYIVRRAKEASEV